MMPSTGIMDAGGWQAFIDGMMLLIMLFNVGVAAFSWKMRATYVSHDDLDELEGKLETRLKERDKAVEMLMKTSDDRVIKLEVGMATLAGDIHGVREIMLRVEHQVQLLVEYRMMESRQ